MKCSFIILFSLSPISIFAGTGETVQVKSFYAAIVGILLLVLFFEKISSSLKLTWMRFSKWIVKQKNELFGLKRAEKLKKDLILVKKHAFSLINISFRSEGHHSL